MNVLKIITREIEEFSVCGKGLRSERKLFFSVSGVM